MNPFLHRPSSTRHLVTLSIDTLAFDADSRADRHLQDLPYRGGAPLANVSTGHKCARLHGHSFRVELHLRGEPDPALGWVMDFADLKSAFAPIHDALDHRYLNDVPGLENPTSEQLAEWIWQRLRPSLPLLREVVIHETCSAGARYSEP